MDPRAIKVASEVLQVDIWIAFDKDFEADDGLAVYYVDELPLLRGKDLIEMQAVQRVKLEFPGCKVTDRKFETAPPVPLLPFVVKFTDDEILKLRIWWKKKYSKNAGNYFDFDDAWIGLLGEETFERFLKASGLLYDRPSAKAGRDPFDFRVGSWRIDVKTQQGPYPFADNFRLHVNIKKVEERSPINTYQFAYLNTKTNEVTLVGWILRKEFARIGIRREKGTMDNKLLVRQTQKDIRGSETRSEEFYLSEYPGRINDEPKS